MSISSRYILASQVLTEELDRKSSHYEAEYSIKPIDKETLEVFTSLYEILLHNLLRIDGGAYETGAYFNTTLWEKKEIQFEICCDFR